MVDFKVYHGTIVSVFDKKAGANMVSTAQIAKNLINFPEIDHEHVHLTESKIKSEWPFNINVDIKKRED